MKRRSRILALLMAVVVAFSAMGIGRQDAFAAAMKFKDVKSGTWYYSAVKYVFDKGIMTGKSETVFGVNDSITRAEAVNVLWRMSGEDAPAVTVSVFPDVPAGKWYTKAVAWAKAAGVVSGNSEGRFEPGKNISRQDFCIILKNYTDHTYLELKETVSGSYRDMKDAGSVSGYARSSVEWAYKRGFIGKGDSLNPKGDLTRAEAAAMFSRFDQAIADAKIAATLNIEPIADKELTIAPTTGKTKKVAKIPSNATKVDPIVNRIYMISPAKVTSVSGNLNDGIHWDTYTISDVKVSGNYRFWVSYVENGMLLKMMVIDQDQNIIANDGALSTGDGVMVSLEKGKSYRYSVGHYGGTYGSYSVSVGQPNEPVTINKLTNIIYDSFEFKNQRNTYLITPEVTGTYRFDFSDLGTDMRPGIKISGPGIQAADVLVTQNGGGVTMLLTAGKTYTVTVFQHSALGEYTLNVGKQKVTSPISGYTEVSDRIQFTDQVNVYNYTTAGSGRYRFEFSGLEEGASVDLRITDSNGNTVADSTSRGNLEGTTVTLSGNTTYFVRVTQRKGFSNYTLNIGAPKPVVDLTKYTAVSDRTQYRDQANVYELTASVTGKYRFEFADIKNDAHFYLSISDENGAVLASSFYMDNGDGVTADLEDGKKYSVTVTQDHDTGTYTLLMGKAKAEATITKYTAVSDSIEYKGQENTYLFVPKRDGIYNFEFDGLADGCTLSMEIYTAAMKNVSRGLDLGNGKGIHEKLEGGQAYRIFVKQYSGTGSYTLKVGQQKAAANITAYLFVTDSIQFSNQENRYKFVPETDGKYTFVYKDMPKGMKMGITIYDSKMKKIDGAAGFEKGGSRSVELKAGKTYYIAPSQFAEFGAYTLQVVAPGK